jgi:hypothetical protein
MTKAKRLPTTIKGRRMRMLVTTMKGNRLTKMKKVRD